MDGTQMRVVTNKARHTAIAVREGRKLMHYVVMEGGALRMRSLPKPTFDETWKPMEYPIERAVERFLAHAKKNGASKDVFEALVAFAPPTERIAVPAEMAPPPPADDGGQLSFTL